MPCVASQPAHWPLDRRLWKDKKVVLQVLNRSATENEVEPQKAPAVVKMKANQPHRRQKATCLTATGPSR